MSDYILLAAQGLSPAQAAITQALEDYPKSSTSWMKDYDWTWPKSIPLDQIDFSDKAQWDAQPDDVQSFKKKITKGKQKPAILVKPKGKSKYMIADGHHRALACQELNRPLLAWTCNVPAGTGGWTKMHDAEVRNLKASNLSDLEVILLAADSMAKASSPQILGPKPLWKKKGFKLPDYIEHVAHALIAHGHSESEAIAIAVNVVKGWAAGKPMGGEKRVHNDTKAAAAKAVAEWTALKAAAHGSK